MNKTNKTKVSRSAINIVFDGPPSHQSGRFVEVETDNGGSIKVGEWIDRGNGYWALRITSLPKDPINEYFLGDWVKFMISGYIDGEKVETEIAACVAETRLASDTKSQYIEYGLSTSPTDVYHQGKPVRWWRKAELLKPVQ